MKRPSEQTVSNLEKNKENITNLLQQKVRDQAKRLGELQKYKSLCESRIKQISPNHPFPVTGQHLLLKREFSSETNFSFGNGIELVKKQNDDYKLLFQANEDVRKS